MSPVDVAETMKHVRVNWPKCEWPAHIAQRVAEDLGKIQVHVGQAKAAIDRLYMRTKFAPKPFEMLDAIKADAVFVQSDAQVEYAAVKAVSAKWSGVLQAMLNLKGTDWVRTVWLAEVGKEIYGEYMIATKNDPRYSKQCTISFVEWATNSISQRPFCRPFSESPIARAQPQPVGAAMNTADGFTHRAQPTTTEASK